jgi:predicted secreted protein
MNFLSVLVVFLSSWWMIFFMLLPIGVRHDESEVIGHQSGAPDRAMIKKKLIWTTIAAFVVSGIILYLIHLDVFSFRTLAHYWE